MRWRPTIPGRVLVLAVAWLGANPGGHATVISLDGPWLLATDPGDSGRAGKWWTGPRPEARPTKVPWIIQGTLPG